MQEVAQAWHLLVYVGATVCQLEQIVRRCHLQRLIMSNHDAVMCVHGIQGKAGTVGKEMSSVRVQGNMKLWVLVVFESGSNPSF